MRLIKMNGLVVMAAIAAMAFIGTSAASASELYIALCANDELVCASPLKHVHEIDSNALLHTSIVDILCEALFLGDVLSAGLLAHLTLLISGKFTYTNCETEGEAPCEAKELNGPSNISVMKTGAEKGEVTGEGEVLVDCSTTPHCVYNGENLKGSAFGPLLKGPNGETTLHKQVVKKVSGFFCPSTSELSVLYKPLKPTYISS